MTYNAGRALIIPPEIGNLYDLSLSLPTKPQMAVLDYSLDLSLLLAAEGSNCAAASVAIMGPPEQTYPMEVVRQPLPGPVITVWIGKGDLFVSYALRFEFVTVVPGEPTRTYSLDAWVTVANVANYSGSQGAYMSGNTGYPTGVGPTGPAGAAAITSVAADQGMAVTNGILSINGLLLPTSETGLPVGTPWNNNGVMSFATGV